MKYKFPHFMNIKEVLPAIEGAPEFIVAEREGYTVLSYVHVDYSAGAETFPEVPSKEAETLAAIMRVEINTHAAIRRECRGLVFCSDTGNVLSRGYHKFFNQDERAETRDIDLSQPHIILEKLDGSMIRPLFIGKNKRPRWITKMGITEVAMQVESWLSANPAIQQNYENLAQSCKETYHTPIFEWCSRKQRIVLDYPEDQLVLTAIRDNRTGDYVSYSTLQRHGEAWNIPVVKTVGMDYLQQDGIEGIVIRFADGHMVKVKTEWYVLRHRALDGLRAEKNVIKLILDNGVDDVLPILDDATKQRLTEYVNTFNHRVTTLAHVVNSFVEEKKDFTRKDFALWVQTHVDKPLHPVAFKVFDGKDAGDAILERVAKSLRSQDTVDNIRYLIGATW